MHRDLLWVPLALFLVLPALAADKPPLTSDEAFNYVSYNDLKVSPDGRAVVLETERADWDHDRYRSDLWLWREATGAVLPLTQSGHDRSPQWSPDGRWVAFLSDRTPQADIGPEAEKDEDQKEPVAHLYLISTEGGEAFAVTRGLEEVHAFAWSPDSKHLYFATREPWSKAKRDEWKKAWKDTDRWRDAERGDVLARIEIADALARSTWVGSGVTKTEEEKKKKKEKEEETALTTGAVLIASTPWRVQDMQVSPDGKQLAFATGSVGGRIEKVDGYEIFVTALEPGSKPRQLTRNNGLERDVRWSPDGKSLFFMVWLGAFDGPYVDLQNKLYSLDLAGGKVTQWAAAFDGAPQGFELTSTGALLSPGQLRTEQQLYAQPAAGAKFAALAGWAGTYHRVSPAARSPRLAFVYSALGKPAEIYLADDPAKLSQARPITAFNKLLTERALPQGKPYQWKSQDGTPVEGMLIYPPGKFEAKGLPLLVLVHGGPADADGNRLNINWYDWQTIAASNGWLVFCPNYRGSSGYGDQFLKAIVPDLVSSPGRDILTGVDALVRDGIADPDRLAIGGYSYGGYMTNWLLTQTTRFKAAVTGAGAVEHASNWGNDDLTLDDAYYLGGHPWEAPDRYHREAALFQFNKVRTPTHVVGGGSDIRVAVSQNYLLERALHILGVPSALLIFPGEGHGLGKNPWHGKIKVREELKWLEKHVLQPAPPAAASR